MIISITPQIKNIIIMVSWHPTSVIDLISHQMKINFFLYNSVNCLINIF